MPYFDRFDICEAYQMYATLWAPDPIKINDRLRRIQFKPGISLRLENLTENSKQIYGQLVCRHERLYVGFERLYRRMPNCPVWPGTSNMPGGDARRWLKQNNLLEAVESMVSQ